MIETGEPLLLREAQQYCSSHSFNFIFGINKDFYLMHFRLSIIFYYYKSSRCDFVLYTSFIICFFSSECLAKSFPYEFSKKVDILILATSGALALYLMLMLENNKPSVSRK